MITKLRRAATLRGRRGADQGAFYLGTGGAGLEVIKKSGLFSPLYYAEFSPEMLLSAMDPLSHYLRVGEGLGRLPHPLFDPGWYATQGGRPDPKYSSYLVDFLTRGGGLGLSPHPLFDSSYYLERRPDVATSGDNPLDHFINHGHREGMRPNPYFDTDWYRRTYMSSELSPDPLSHFVTQGEKLGYRPSPGFDPLFYKSKYPDLSNERPTNHFLAFGHDEGRTPYNRQDMSLKAKIAVVAHIFFEDIWPEIKVRLSYFPDGYDLFITAPKENLDLLATLRRECPNAKIIPVYNLGRDILPLLEILPELVRENYVAVCKIHTKKGITEPETWRQMLLDGVAFDARSIIDIINYFMHDRDIVLAGSNELNLDGIEFIGENKNNLIHACDIVGDSYRENLRWSFIAGSMFWFRPSFFARLSKKNLISRFEVEHEIIQDGMMMHAVERLFGYMAAAAGKRMLLVDTSGRALANPLEAVVAPGRAMQYQLIHYLPERAAKARQGWPENAKVARTARPFDGTKRGLNFIGPAGSVNGLGVSVRGYLQAAVSAGLPLNVIPWTLGFERVANIAVDHPTGPAQDISVVHLNLDIMSGLRLLDHEPLQSMLRAGSYNVCIPYWELNAIPEAWIETLNRFDEIWAPSSFIHRAVSAVTRTPVHVVRPAASAPAPRATVTASRPRFGIPDDAFVFFYSADAGSVPARKNPLGYWQAYANEFSPGEGACCVLKLGYADPQGALVSELRRIAAGRADMVLIMETLPEDEMASLFSAADCYVSPHRSEGLGLTVIESMRAGKPVIATRYGGVTDLVTPETALIVEHRLREVGEGSHPYPPHYVWADPLENSLRSRLREIRQSPELRTALSRKGRQAAEDLFGLEAAGRGLRAQVDRIYAARRLL